MVNTGNVSRFVARIKADTQVLLMIEETPESLLCLSKETCSLAQEKTEMVVLTNEGILTVLSIQVSETLVLSKPARKCHGIMIDAKMNFFD